MSVEQIKGYTTTINGRTISGSLSGVSYNWNNAPETNNNCKIKLTTANNDDYSGQCTVTRTGNWFNYSWTYTITINNWTVTYEDPNQPVNISLEYSDATYKGTCTIQDLIDRNITIQLDTD